MIKVLAAFMAMLVPVLGQTQNTDSYRCTFGDITRRIEIFREPGRLVPCEVHYFKDSEAPGSREVLWSASSEAGYCSKKTAAFIAKLADWGWDCSDGTAAGTKTDAGTEAAPETAVPADPVGVPDDTSALAPVEEKGESGE